MEQALGYVVLIIGYTIGFFLSMYIADRVRQSIDPDYRQAIIYRKILLKEFRVDSHARVSRRHYLIKLTCYKEKDYVEPLLPEIQLAFDRMDTTLEERRGKAILVIPIKRGLKKPVKKVVSQPEVKIVPRGA